MYVLQDKPDESVVLSSLEHAEYKTTVHPVATLKDEYGGEANIIVDDHCYVLLLKRDFGFLPTPYWFSEAVDAVKTLPTPK